MFFYKLRKDKTMKNKFKKITQIILALLITVALGLVYLGVRDYHILMREKPIDNVVHSIIIDDDFVSFSEIDQMVKDAVVVTEDRRFYERKSALDLKAIGRATVRNIKNFQFLEGGSTIPQQLAKNMYFDHSASLRRKVSEYLIAKDLLNEYNKDEILTMYLNLIYFGDGYYGISEAAEGYFDKSALELNDHEATLLAGLPQAPPIYHLSGNYEGARKRQSQVLRRLVDNDFITEKRAKEIYNMGDSYEKEND